MTKLGFPSHPMLLGFDQLERLLERTTRAAPDGYPPFNIEQCDENAYRITLAVAGFDESDLSITIEDSQLMVRGQHPAPDETRVFLHRGIAARQFQRGFALGEGVEVSRAELANGLLHIDLTRAIPETVVKTIPITRA